MRKLTTLALALIMTIALALPAFATYGWEQKPSEETTQRLPGFEVTMAQYQFTPATTGFDWQQSYYTQWSPTQAVVAGTNVRFVVTVNAIAKSGITESIVRDIATLRLSVSSPNLFINSASSLRYIKNSTTGNFEAEAVSPTDRSKNITNGSFSWTIGDMTEISKATMMKVMFTAQVRETKEAVVTAELRCGTTQFGSDGTYGFTMNNNKYTVLHDKNYFYIWNDETPLRVVRFTVDSDSKVTDVHVSLADLSSERITTVTPLTNAEQAAMLELVDKEYTNIALNYAMASDSVAKGLSLYYRAYNLWQAAVLKAGIGFITDAVYWTNSTPAYANLTDTGKTAFEKYIADVVKNTSLTENDMAKPDSTALYQLAKEYMLGATSTSYQNKINELANYANSGSAPASELYVPYAGEYLDASTNAFFANASALNRAVINAVMLDNAYVYYVNANQYTSYTGNAFSSISVGSTFSRTTSNIHGQIGKVGSGDTVVAPYYRVSYNVNNGVLSFGTNAATLDAGFDMLLDEHGTVPSTPGYMAKLFGVDGYPSIETLTSTFNAGSALAVGSSTRGATNIELYGKVDDVRAKEAGFIVDSAYITSGSTFESLKNTFNEIINVLGFKWDGTTSYMYEGAFLANFAGTLSINATCKYLAYTGNLVVTDPDVQPPQTGDAYSAIGFVMLGMGIIALTVIALRKKVYSK